MCIIRKIYGHKIVNNINVINVPLTGTILAVFISVNNHENDGCRNGGSAMKRILGGIFVILMTTAFCTILQPTISSADTYEILRELNLSNETHTETISTQINEQGEELSGFKGVSISVQNGTEDSKFRVACAEVFLDGKEIFSENDFNSSFISLTETLEYPEDTMEIELKVRVSGTWKSALKVIVTGIYEEDVSDVTRYYLDRDGDGVGGDIYMDSTVPLTTPWVLITGDINDYDPKVQ
jgi:hypothetical protein